MEKLKNYTLKVEDREYNFTDEDLSRLFCEHNDYQKQEFVDEKWRLLDIKKDIKGKSVLDLGCNSGRIGIKCHEAGVKDYTGVDSNWRYLEDCHDQGIKGDFVRMELNDFAKIWKKKFDVVLCLATFHYIIDKEEFIKKMADISKEMFVLEGPVENGDPEFAPKQELVEALLNKYFKSVEFCGPSVSPSPKAIHSKRFIWKCKNNL